MAPGFTLSDWALYALWVHHCSLTLLVPGAGAHDLLDETLTPAAIAMRAPGDVAARSDESCSSKLEGEEEDEEEADSAAAGGSLPAPGGTDSSVAAWVRAHPLGDNSGWVLPIRRMDAKQHWSECKGLARLWCGLTLATGPCTMVAFAMQNDSWDNKFACIDLQPLKGGSVLTSHCSARCRQFGGKVRTKQTKARVLGRGQDVSPEQMRLKLPVQALPHLLGRHEAKRKRAHAAQPREEQIDVQIAAQHSEGGSEASAQAARAAAVGAHLAMGKENDMASSSASEGPSGCKRPRVGR